MKRMAALAVSMVVVGIFWTGCAEREQADRIFTHGHVVTMNDSLPLAEAFAVAGGRILRVGSSAEIESAYPDAAVVDLGGRTIMPGIVESHVHLFSLGRSFIELNVVGADSPEEVAQMVKERAAAATPGDWITGWGWDEGDWAADYPSNEVLNRAAPENPVWLRGLHGFAGWANAEALEIAGISRETPDPENGEILKDARTGVPTGILTNKAQLLLTRNIPAISTEQMERALSLATEECLKYGLTSVHDANIDGTMLEALRSLKAKRALNTRVWVMLDCTDRELLEPFWQDGPELDPEGWLTIRCVKIFADGALGSRGAAFLEPYSDAPETRGLMTTPAEEIRDLTERSLRAGLQVAVHAIGDRANRLTLDVFESVLGEFPEDIDHRLRVEHAQVVAPEDIPRFAEMNIVVSMQPPHATSDMPWAEARTGPERIAGAYAWRSFLNTGARVPLNSDFPGETLNPFWGMYAAETRQTPEGEPEGGWYPDQCLTRNEVLRAYTVESAYAGFEEDVKGQIAPGMFADFIVLSDDILMIPSKELLSLDVLQTYVAGELVYER